MREDTTTADVPGVPMPFVRRRTRVRKRGRAIMGPVTEGKWRTHHVKGDVWKVKKDGKWILGRWRTVGGHRMFFPNKGGVLSGIKKRGILARIKGALGKLGAGRREEHMSELRSIAQRLLDEAEGARSASKNVVELLAVDMAEAPKVQRKLAKLLGDKAAGATEGLATALMPILTKWLEAQGVKVQGAAAAEKELRAAAKQ